MNETHQLINELTEAGVTLYLDDDTLHVDAPKGLITPERYKKISDNKQAITAFLQQHTPSSNNTTNLLNSKPTPLQPATLSINDTINAHSQPLISSLFIEGELNSHFIISAWRHIATQHDLLRHGQVQNNNGWHLSQNPHTEPSYCIENYQHIAEEERIYSALKYVQSIRQNKFDPATDHLARLNIVEFSDQCHLLVLHIHPYICDEISLELIWSMLSEHHDTLSARKILSRPSHPIQKNQSRKVSS